MYATRIAITFCLATEGISYVAYPQAEEDINPGYCVRWTVISSPLDCCLKSSSYLDSLV